MNARRLVNGLLGLLVLGVVPGLRAQGADAPERGADLRLDFARHVDGAPLQAGVERDGYAVTATAKYEAATQSFEFDGTYRVTEPLAPGAKLSYQIYDDAGNLLQFDGARFDWDAGGTVATFVLELPMLAERPDLTVVRLQFNAVVEGEYWYNDRFPDVRFAAVDLVNLPRRDQYRPRWTWVPSILPAQTRCQIPAAWSIGYRDEARSGFVASLDVVDEADTERIDSRRVDFSDHERGDGSIFAWLPLSPLVAGTVEVRPGLVWDNVRWYDADGWFDYVPVRVVPPLVYVAGAILVAGLLGAAWWWCGRWPSGVARSAGRVVTLLGWGWLGANLLVSGYWLVPVLLVAMAWSRRLYWQREGMPTYAVAWLMMAFLEIYWGRMSGVARVWDSATAFSLATWAVVLLPLAFLRRRWLRRSIGLIVIVGWLLVSTAAVIYYQFFQDFPSVENLLYAGQVGELGDSITSLVEQRHLVPLLVMGAALVIWWWPRAEQRSAKHEA